MQSKYLVNNNCSQFNGVRHVHCTHQNVSANMCRDSRLKNRVNKIILTVLVSYNFDVCWGTNCANMYIVHASQFNVMKDVNETIQPFIPAMMHRPLFIDIVTNVVLILLVLLVLLIHMQFLLFKIHILKINGHLTLTKINMD